MAQLSFDLPADLQRHLDARIAEGNFVDPAAYFRALVTRDQNEYRADVARVQALIDEGFASGVVERDGFEILDEIVAGTRLRHG